MCGSLHTAPESVTGVATRLTKVVYTTTTARPDFGDPGQSHRRNNQRRATSGCQSWLEKRPHGGVRLVAYSAGERHCSDHKVGWRQSVCHRPSELVVTPLFDVSTKAATNVKGKTHASRIVSKTFFEVFRFIVATLDKFSQNAK